MNKLISLLSHKGVAALLQMVVVLLGIGVLTALLWEPHLEGVNANATTLSEIYFDDSFLAYVYLGSIPFFVGLYQAFKILKEVGGTGRFSENSVRALRNIKYCALITAGAIVAADVFLAIMSRSNGEDAAGAVALGILATLASIVVAVTARVFERNLRPLVADQGR
jgi:hypothetical protein